MDNWKHRSKNMKCCTCMFYVEKTTSIGRCRRHSPKLEGWPVVRPNDWCGDHKLDEEKLNEQQGV